MVPSNILQRTFHISFNGEGGTGFTIDVAGKQYLVTAKHVVEGIAPSDQLMVLRGGNWVPVALSGVWHSATGADLSVLSLVSPLSPTHPVRLGDASSFFLSERIYFLGFPFGLHMDAAQQNNGYPIPFVKTGIVSSFSSVQNGSQLIYLDGHNNPGFSGGPVVTVSQDHVVSIIGVVSAYRHNEESVLLNGQDTGLLYRANTGLVIAYALKEAARAAENAANGASLAGV